MAKFQIKMLTSRIDNDLNTVSYIETPITEFYSQSDIYENQQDAAKNILLNQLNTYCYTFNEKVSFHTNGQKELQFSMLRNIWLDNELTVNPFVSALKNGSQVLLIDQYDNEYMFTIKDISYNLGASNITYNYSCQDSFTYQHIRQNDGYVITNDPSTDTFIGAKSADWWIANKIQPECHITYTFLPFEQGLYMDKNRNIHVFKSHVENVYKVVKPIFSKENYPEYYERIPFAVSGSNASAALISLAEELGLMLNYCECGEKVKGVRTGRFRRYFWLEPKKNEKTSNLKYSPKTTIQSFNFSQKGDSLSTILNVEGKKTDDEMLTLLPRVPYFFSSMFSSAAWDKTSYENGFFTAVCDGESYICDSGVGDFQATGMDGSNEKYLEFQIYTEKIGEEDNAEYYFKIPHLYDKVSLKSENKTSYAVLDDVKTSIFNRRWEFVVKMPKPIQDGDKSPSIKIGDYLYATDENGYLIYNEEVEEKVYNSEDSLIPSSLWGQSPQCFIRIYLDHDSTNQPDLGLYQFVLRFHRDVSSEELEFAEIADKCPWLENKIIDFSYFYKNKILSQLEYQSLTHIIQNDLRIVNGKLLYYSDSYYRAIQSKTKIMAELLSTLDSIGAAFASDVVSQFQSNGGISNVDYFDTAYNTMISKYIKTNDTSLIINHKETLTEYWNKYFNARQRFLKNIYNFRNYFNQPKYWGDSDAELYKIRFTLKELDSLSPDSLERCYWTFSKNISFSPVDSNFDKYDEKLKPFVTIYEKDKKTVVNVIDQYKINNAIDTTKEKRALLYTNTINPNDVIFCNEKYDINFTYLRMAFATSISEFDISEKDGEKQYDIPQELKISSDDTNPNITDDNETILYFYKKDENTVWYCSAVPEAQWCQQKAGSNEVIDRRSSKLWDSIIVTPTPDDDNRSFTLKKTYVQVYKKDIITDFIYNSFYTGDGNTNGSWYYHEENTLENTNTWWSYSNSVLENIKYFKPDVFGTLLTEQDWEKSVYADFVSHLRGWKTDKEDLYKAIKKLYVRHFPITEVYWHGADYKPAEENYNNNDININKGDYVAVNEVGDSYVDYLKWQESKDSNKKEYKQNPYEYKKYFFIPVVNPDNQTNYFKRVGRTGWRITSGVITGASLVFGFGLLSLAAAAAFEYHMRSLNKWATSGWNEWDFEGNKLDNKYQYYANRSKIVYATSETAYDEYKALKNKSILLNKNQKNTTEISSGKWYFNYYSKIAHTYSTAMDANIDYYFYDKYLRLLQNTEKVGPDYKYRILVLGNDEKGKITNDIFEEGCGLSNLEDKRISKIKYYFLDQLTTEQTFEECVELNRCAVAWEEDGYVGKKIVQNDEGKQYHIYFVVFQDEDFKRVRILKDLVTYKKDNNGELIIDKDGFVIDKQETLTPDERFSFYSLSKKIHNKAEAKIVNFATDFEYLTRGFFRYAIEDGGFTEITKSTKITLTTPADVESEELTKFFILNGKEYERVYTIEQIKTMQNQFYYVNNLAHEVEIIGKKLDFNLPVYLHRESYVQVEDDSSNTKIKLDDVVVTSYELKTTINESLYTKEDKKLENQSLKINKDGYEYARNCDVQIIDSEPIAGLTNGEFWYKYHTRHDNPILFEDAAAIESQLTQYWVQAYTASLNCEYFLPEYWQPRADGGKNYFSNNIMNVVDDKDADVFKVSLLNKYLPEVAMYQGSTLHPKWDLEHIGMDRAAIYTQDTTKKAALTESYSSAEILQDNPAYIQAFAELGESMSNYQILNDLNTTLQRKTNYYYVSNENSGTKWKDVLPTHSNIAARYEQFSGLYVMAYKLLKSKFGSRDMSQYEDLKAEQQRIWQELYQQFPGVLLETSYTNEHAATSAELYQMASIAFKDQIDVENSYSISLINAYKDLSIKKDGDQSLTTYENYRGQELKIGESILVDAEEYYDRRDDLQRALSQYLFITDLSYDLRKDSDISLTVNAIKYQDKLIQRLVKLIK